MFNRVNAFQIVLHMIGCLATIWQILNLNQFRMMWSIMAFFGAIPFALEVGVLFMALTRYRVIDQVEYIQRNLEAKARAKYEERVKIEEARFKGAAAAATTV